jgi:hypothetical protein
VIPSSCSLIADIFSLCNARLVQSFPYDLVTDSDIISHTLYTVHHFFSALFHLYS